MTTPIQKQAFLEGGEADAWFTRNRASLEVASPWRVELARRIAAYVGANDRVLEIGCGQGANLEELRRLVPVLAHGIDPSMQAVQTGLQRLPDADLQCGTSDRLPWPEEHFNLVWFGFCLYLVDRSLLFRSIAEADRVLADGGTLAILDFEPDVPFKRPYHHRPGLWSYKMDYSKLLLANPAYRLIEKYSLSHAGTGWVSDPQERLGLFILRKDTVHAYRHE